MKIYICITSEQLINRWKKCLLNGPGHSMEDCKFLKEYSNNYSAQRLHTKSCFRGKDERRKTVKFNSKMQYMDCMEPKATSTTKNKKRVNHSKNIKSDPDTSASTDHGQNYEIDWLNLGENSHDLENDSEWLPAQHRKIQMAYENNSSIRNKHKCNVLYNFLNHKTC